MNATWHISNTKHFEALHDLGAPVQALGSLVKELGTVPRSQRLQLHCLVQRMESILRQEGNENQDKCDPRAILVDLLFEKRALRPEAKIKFLAGEEKKSTAALPAPECFRLFSNCLDHAFLVAHDSLVTIQIRDEAGFCRVDIKYPATRSAARSLPLHFASTKANNWGGQILTRQKGANETLSIFLPKQLSHDQHVG